MIYKLLYNLFKKKDSTPVAIKAGHLNNAIIENNVAIGMRLLEADKIEKSSVKGNRVYLPAPKEVKLIWKVLLDIFVILIAAYLIFIFGWNQ